MGSVGLRFKGSALELGDAIDLGSVDQRDFDASRANALLAAAYGVVRAEHALPYLRGAIEKQRAGEQPLALMYLALAGLAKLADVPGAEWRLSAAADLMKQGIAPEAIVRELSLNSSAAGKYSPDQPRVPAGNGRESGQWTEGEDTGSDSRAPANREHRREEPKGIRIADAAADWAKYLVSAESTNRAKGDDAAGHRAANSNPGVRAILPNGQPIPTGEKIPYLLSPTADLEPVAAAGRQVGSTYEQMLQDPNVAEGAIVYLLVSLDRYVGQGGVFDYQREGNRFTGFDYLPQFVRVANFNVGLFCQQAGLSLDETLTISGTFAHFRSSNAKPDNPYGLAELNRQYITLGFKIGADGYYDPRSP